MSGGEGIGDGDRVTCGTAGWLSGWGEDQVDGGLARAEQERRGVQGVRMDVGEGVREQRGRVGKRT